MLSFKSFLTEAKSEVGGILHLEHPADRLFDGPEATAHAIKTLKGIASGRVPITRKIDDKMSFQVIRRQDGKVGVKYKGTGATYNFSQADVDQQHGDKPYLAAPLKHILKHVGKVIPDRPGEYQGGYMSAPEERAQNGAYIGHTPNTIQYMAHQNTPEGARLKASKVSLTIHSELKGPNRTAEPILDTSEFKEHPDVHIVRHTVDELERQLHPKHKQEISDHIKQAEALLDKHDHSHQEGHSETLRSYINSTVSSGEAPSVEGYKTHLEIKHNKQIEKLKSDKGKAAAEQKKALALGHVDKNASKFKKTLAIHGHLQAAANKLADGISRNGTGGFITRMNGEPSGGEGFVGGGLKIVNRTEFTRQNNKRREMLRAQQ
jgi:Family of unknown function (DUF6267)